jgi:hypothetical protein
MEADSTLLQDIQKDQLKDEKMKKIKCDIKEEMSPGFMKIVTK